MSSSINAQNPTYDLGASLNGSIMKSDYGYILGTGFKIDNRFSLYRTNLSLKSSLGFTKYYDYDIKLDKVNKDYDNLWMLDMMLEYNFFLMTKQHLTSTIKNWTPYISAGTNIIYRTDIESKTIATIKGGLGIKYKLNNNLLLIAEGYLEYDFSDDLDDRIEDDQTWYQYDHTANFSIGLSYRFNCKRYSKRWTFSH